jgi:hypothetical protein
MKNLLKPSFFLFLLAALIWNLPASAQDKNAYQFIEPNISISYDSNLYKISELLGSQKMTKNSYSFTMKAKDLAKTKILVRSEITDMEATQWRQDSIIKTMDSAFIAMIKADSTVLKVTEKKLTTLQGFSCLGIAGYEPDVKRHSSSLVAVRLFKTGITIITLVIDEQKDLSKSFDVLNTLLSGYKFYTAEEMEKEEEAIKKNYTITVDSVAFSLVEKNYKRSTYAGIVRLSPKPEHKIYGVMLGNQVFSEQTGAVANNEIRISLRDHEPGKFTHNGSLIVLNSFGKRVWLPFTITYTNTKSE